MDEIFYKDESFQVKDSELNLEKKNIESILDLKGLDSLINLKGLNLRFNKIREIVGLENLLNLESLGLEGNNINEIKGLESLKKLKFLDLEKNHIVNIEGLENLQSLEELSLGNNHILEIKGLESLGNLEMLYLEENEIDLIKGLDKNLQNLSQIYLTQNYIEIIEGLDNLVNLEFLWLDENRIKQITGLDKLKNLIELHLENNRIEEIMGLENLVKIEYIIIYPNPINREEYHFIYSDAKSLVNYCKLKGQTSLNMMRKKKETIHEIIHNKILKRCPLHQELNSTCMKLDEIVEIIRTPAIIGFFMYEFPREPENISNMPLKEKYMQYIKEIEKIKELIEKANKDPYIDIRLPQQVTGLDVKTCDFCKFSRSFDFGILLLNPINPNAFLEAGMFLSLGKKVILLNNESLSRTAPFDLTPYFYIHYETLEELEINWNRKIPQYLSKIKQDYLNF